MTPLRTSNKISVIRDGLIDSEQQSIVNTEQLLTQLDSDDYNYFLKNLAKDKCYEIMHDISDSLLDGCMRDIENVLKRIQEMNKLTLERYYDLIDAINAYYARLAAAQQEQEEDSDWFGTLIQVAGIVTNIVVSTVRGGIPGLVASVGAAVIGGIISVAEGGNFLTGASVGSGIASTIIGGINAGNLLYQGAGAGLGGAAGAAYQLSTTGQINFTELLGQMNTGAGLGGGFVNGLSEGLKNVAISGAQQGGMRAGGIAAGRLGYAKEFQYASGTYGLYNNYQSINNAFNPLQNAQGSSMGSNEALEALTNSLVETPSSIPGGSDSAPDLRDVITILSPDDPEFAKLIHEFYQQNPPPPPPGSVGNIENQAVAAGNAAQQNTANQFQKGVDASAAEVRRAEAANNTVQKLINNQQDKINQGFFRLESLGASGVIINNPAEAAGQGAGATVVLQGANAEKILYNAELIGDNVTETFGNIGKFTGQVTRHLGMNIAKGLGPQAVVQLASSATVGVIEVSQYNETVSQINNDIAVLRGYQEVGVKTTQNLAEARQNYNSNISDQAAAEAKAYNQAYNQTKETLTNKQLQLNKQYDSSVNAREAALTALIDSYETPPPPAPPGVIQAPKPIVEQPRPTETQAIEQASIAQGVALLNTFDSNKINPLSARGINYNLARGMMNFNQDLTKGGLSMESMINLSMLQLLQIRAYIDDLYDQSFFTGDIELVNGQIGDTSDQLTKNVIQSNKAISGIDYTNNIESLTEKMAGYVYQNITTMVNGAMIDTLDNLLTVNANQVVFYRYIEQSIDFINSL